MPDQLVTLPLTQALQHLTGPEQVHRLAMGHLPDLRGASRAIRADLGVLYRLALPTELGGSPGNLTIRYRTRAPVSGAVLVEAPDALAVGQRITARVVAEKRHEDERGRTITRFVGDEEAEDWAHALLLRHGLQAGDLKVSPRWTFGDARGPRGTKPTSFTLRDVTATLTTVEDASAYTRGIGRGKAYGYGLPLVL
ncbi:type I-E CRISPR-associated protein Cas6/Cse3/CasE [Actinomyces marmotae]|uniref:Type I-E CRISPR-associated protein Cas6/Cse3/CasE n=1 Tax=Actinomyces marmotae TaxID=2737173 RepID=A0A6M8AZP5_9ACTO|nr:type I-E CRISPR-associated protein Cas6/Cse3/CasE [Actinomyces marmotae]QKD80079.1 type I-E CRISPR-associated protein Cas6/Cse3/CasE [Actinomyces marmotae]